MKLSPSGKGACRQRAGGGWCWRPEPDAEVNHERKGGSADRVRRLSAGDAHGDRTNRGQWIDSGHRARYLRPGGAGRDRDGDPSRDRRRDEARNHGRRRVRVVAASSRRVPRRGDTRRVPDLRAGQSGGRCARRGRPQRDAAGWRRRTGGHRVGGGAAAEQRRRSPWPDDPERGLHGAAAGHEHRRTARSDGVHVPDARRAVGRALGQRDGRAGFHQRHLRRRRADHQRRRPGRRPQPLVRHLGRSRRSVPGRDQRHGSDVQRPGCVELRRQIGDERVSRQRLRVLPQQGARLQVVLRGGQAGRQPARVRLHARRSDPAQPHVLLRRVRRLPRSAPDRVAPGVDSDRRAAQRRLQRAAGRHLRSVDDEAESERDGIRPRSVPRQHHPGESHLADLAQLPVVPAGSVERGAAEQLPRRVAADRLQQRQRHDEGRSEPLGAAPDVGALLARRAPPAHAVSRRRERADGAAAALHGDAAGRGGADDGAGQAHAVSSARAG